MARYVLRARKFVREKILHTDDTPHAIALGVAAATFVSFFPLPVSQTLLAIGLAALLRANKAVCIPVVWITNPVTAIPIYALCYTVGQAVTPFSSNGAGEQKLQRLMEMEFAPFSATFWKESFNVILSLGVELWIGSLVVGVTFAVPGYFIAKWAVVKHRARRRQRNVRRHQFRLKKRSAAPAPELV